MLVASRYINYPGEVDCVGQIMGPNTFGEIFTVVSCEFDGEKTRVGLVYGRHDLSENSD